MSTSKVRNIIDNNDDNDHINLLGQLLEHNPDHEKLQLLSLMQCKATVKAERAFESGLLKG